MTETTEQLSRLYRIEQLLLLTTTTLGETARQQQANTEAIAQVTIVKKYTVQLHYPKTTQLYANFIAKSEKSKETSDNVSKIFLDRDMNSDNLFTAVFHQADANLYQTEDELGKQ